MSVENRNPGTENYYSLWLCSDLFTLIRRIVWGYMPYLALDNDRNYYTVYIDWFDRSYKEPADMFAIALWQEIGFAIHLIRLGYMPFFRLHQDDGLEVNWKNEY